MPGFEVAFQGRSTSLLRSTLSFLGGDLVITPVWPPTNDSTGVAACLELLAISTAPPLRTSTASAGVPLPAHLVPATPSPRPAPTAAYLRLCVLASGVSLSDTVDDVLSTSASYLTLTMFDPVAGVVVNATVSDVFADDEEVLCPPFVGEIVVLAMTVALAVGIALAVLTCWPLYTSPAFEAHALAIQALTSDTADGCDDGTNGQALAHGIDGATLAQRLLPSRSGTPESGSPSPLSLPSSLLPSPLLAPSSPGGKALRRDDIKALMLRRLHEETSRRYRASRSNSVFEDGAAPSRHSGGSGDSLLLTPSWSPQYSPGGPRRDRTVTSWFPSESARNVVGATDAEALLAAPTTRSVSDHRARRTSVASPGRGSFVEMTSLAGGGASPRVSVDAPGPSHATSGNAGGNASGGTTGGGTASGVSPLTLPATAAPLPGVSLSTAGMARVEARHSVNDGVGHRLAAGLDAMPDLCLLPPAALPRSQHNSVLSAALTTSGTPAPSSATAIGSLNGNVNGPAPSSRSNSTTVVQIKPRAEETSRPVRRMTAAVACVLSVPSLARSSVLNPAIAADLANIAVCGVYVITRFDTVQLYVDESVADVTWVAAAGLLVVSASLYVRTWHGAFPLPRYVDLSSFYMNWLAGKNHKKALQRCCAAPFLSCAGSSVP